MNAKRACVLGAIDGLLCSATIGGLIKSHLCGMIQSASYDVTAGKSIILMASPIPPSIGFIAFLCVLTFTLISYVAHRLLLNRISSLLILWQIIGICTFTLLSTTAYLAEHESSFYESLPRGAWLVCLAAFVIVNFIIGVVVESSAKLYTHT